MPSNKDKGKAPAPAEGDILGDGEQLIPQSITEPNNTGLLSDNRGDHSASNSNTVGRISSSATSLAQSFLQPTVGESSYLVRTAQTSKNQAFTTSAPGNYQNIPGPSQEHAQPTSHNVSNGQGFMGFRSSSATHTTSIVDEEFHRFGSGVSVLDHETALGPTISTSQDPSHQENILQLLSSPGLTDLVWQTEPSPYPEEHEPVEAIVPDLQASQVVEFLATEDIVEFLSREGTIYTEEVWGNMLGVLQEARKEIAETKDINEKQYPIGKAIERLKMIQRQLKSKL